MTIAGSSSSSTGERLVTAANACQSAKCQTICGAPQRLRRLFKVHSGAERERDGERGRLLIARVELQAKVGRKMAIRIMGLPHSPA